MKYLATARHPGEIWEMDDGQKLVGAHFREDCGTDTCVIHAPTDHHMKDFMLIWRDDRMFFERLCPHGVGHPDPDQVAYWDATLDEDDAGAQGVHGCDGCCARPPNRETTFVREVLTTHAATLKWESRPQGSMAGPDALALSELIEKVIDRVQVGDAK